jgi:sugar transferase EpsL
MSHSRASDGVKRLLDIIGGTLGLVSTAPVMLVLAVLILRDLGRPILLVQDRPGLHGEVFRLRKFRTMRDSTNAAGRLLPDAERLTPLGVNVRAWSLDELPQLWNVVRGDMSLVGPRPLLVDYLGRYSPAQARRHEVRPGLTGLAQVTGRNAASWETKLALDVWYVDHRCLLLDLRILARTLVKVLQRDGISYPGQATTLEFPGA